MNKYRFAQHLLPIFALLAGHNICQLERVLCVDGDTNELGKTLYGCY